MPPTDETLVIEACRGDLESFGHLYERYYALAVGIARSRLAELHLAEDAAQEAFAEAFRSLKSLRDRQRFVPWISTICRRKSSQMALGRQSQRSLDEASESAETSADAALRLDVREALGHLDDRSREIVVLHYFSGLSYEEIAHALDLSPDSIHGRLQRARQTLARWLNPEKSLGVKP